MNISSTLHSLAELRSAHGVSQDRLGLAIGTSQPGVKKVEGSGDPRLSTLRRYVEGLGQTVGADAHLQLLATIGEATYVLQLPANRDRQLPATVGQRAWRLRAWDDPLIEQALLDRSLISISADEIGDVSNGPTDDEVRARLRAAPALATRSEQAIGLFVSYWRMFRSDMKVSDIVAVPLSGRRVAVAEIASDYRYLREEPEPRLRHVRDVRWLATIRRESLDDDLRRVVNAPGTICAIGADDAPSRLRDAVA